MRRLAAALLVLGAAACTGLLVDKGNDYPCDFRAPEGERDKVCAPGEVCGVDNLCRPFHYEGPQFEGKPGLPRLDAGTQLHPGQLDAPITEVALNGSVFFADKTPQSTAIVASKGKYFLVDLSHIGAKVTDITALLGGPHVAAAYPDFTRLLAASSDGKAKELFADGSPARPLRDQGGDLDDVRDFRTRFGRSVALRAPTGAFLGESAFCEVNPTTGACPNVPLVLLDDGGTSDAGLKAYDVAVVPSQSFGGLPLNTRPVAVALGADGLSWFEEPLVGPPTRHSLHSTDAEALEVAALGGRAARLRSDTGGRLLAIANGATDLVTAPHKVLSTWSLIRNPLGGAQVARTWPDCTPCPGGSILSFAPGSLGGPAVEVLCAVGKSNVVALKVVGSSASVPQQGCDIELLSTAFEANKLGTRDVREDLAALDAGVGFDLVQDPALTSGVVLGGPRGRLYSGPSFSLAQPVFLDRLPVATGLFPAPDGGQVLAALTERYAAVRVGDEGFEVVDPLHEMRSSLPGVVVSSFIGEAPGWAVLSSGDVLRTDWEAEGLRLGFILHFGPRLVDASDLPATGPFLAEAVSENDGGMRSLVLTANDSLYFARQLGSQTLTDDPNALPSLRPDITPEPNSPIRSLALERSVLGTDGISRVRAYVATARNLYLVQYGGTPARWSAAPLVLTGESPVEVWMDHPRGGLGRVGYPSGEVYTLPGAFLLARSLTASGALEGLDAGAQVAVEDYENLAGWPAAYTRAGLFVANYDVLPDGGLDNKLPDGRLGKPMSWKRVRLSDGSEPWLGKAGRLQAVKGPRVGGSVYTEEWTLVVFTADEVYEAAAATRSNAQ
jgi:hypothetical protein